MTFAADDASTATLDVDGSFLVNDMAGDRRIFRDSRIIPLTGSRPKYFTDNCWPTSSPKALGWLTLRMSNCELCTSVGAIDGYSVTMAPMSRSSTMVAV